MITQKDLEKAFRVLRSGNPEPGMSVQKAAQIIQAETDRLEKDTIGGVTPR